MGCLANRNFWLTFDTGGWGLGGCFGRINFPGEIFGFQIGA